MQQRAMRGAVAVALPFLALFAGCGERGPVAVIRGPGGAVEVSLEVAATPAARERGLMYRTSLAQGRGMLFVFDADGNHSFWMKNTLIPLDMLFIARDGTVVGIHANATPLSTAEISVGKPSRYVLEVPGGWAARHGISAGARVEFRGVNTLGDGARGSSRRNGSVRTARTCPSLALEGTHGSTTACYGVARLVTHAGVSGSSRTPGR